MTGTLTGYCRRAAMPLALAAAAAVLVGGFTWMVRSSNAADRAWANRQKQAFATANTICGSAPRSVTPHGSSWNFGPWLQVTCQDGTVQVVQP